MVQTMPEEGRPTAIVCDLPDCTNPRVFRGQSGILMPDGRGIAFRKAFNIQVQPTSGGAGNRLTNFTDKVIGDFALSPDGTHLAVVRTNISGDIVLITGIR